jgi:hypothetical protein
MMDFFSACGETTVYIAALRVLEAIADQPLLPKTIPGKRL